MFLSVVGWVVASR